MAGEANRIFPPDTEISPVVGWHEICELLRKPYLQPSGIFLHQQEHKPVNAVGLSKNGDLNFDPRLPHAADRNDCDLANARDIAICRGRPAFSRWLGQVDGVPVASIGRVCAAYCARRVAGRCYGGFAERVFDARFDLADGSHP